MYSHISCSCNQREFEFLLMNSSTGSPSIIGSLCTRFCLAFKKIVTNSALRRAFASFSARVSFRFAMGISDSSPCSALCYGAEHRLIDTREGKIVVAIDQPACCFLLASMIRLVVDRGPGRCRQDLGISR